VLGDGVRVAPETKLAEGTKVWPDGHTEANATRLQVS
jgi:hypothetical protein